MSRKRLTRKQIIHKLRQAEVERGKGPMVRGCPPNRGQKFSEDLPPLKLPLTR